MSDTGRSGPAQAGLWLAVFCVIVIGAAALYYTQVPSVLVAIVLFAAACGAGAGVGMMRRKGRRRGSP